MDDMTDPDRLAQTLAAALAESDDEQRIDLLQQAAHAGSAAVRAQVERLLASADPAEQTLGADLAGRLPPGGEEVRRMMRDLGWEPHPPHPEFDPADRAAVGELLRATLATATDADVLDAAIVAASMLDLHTLAPEVARHAGHDDEDVRAAVAYALIGLQLPDEDDQITTLVALAHDPVAEVRSWALVALLVGVGDGDGPVGTPAAVAAYRANADDPDDEVRVEAEAALGLLGDVEMLARSLVSDAGSREAVELALRLRDPRLHAPLVELRGTLRDDGMFAEFAALVDAAITACAPPRS